MGSFQSQGFACLFLLSVSLCMSNNKTGQQKFLTFSDLKSWVAVLSKDNIALFAIRQETTEMQNVRHFQQAIYSNLCGIIQATIRQQLQM